MKQETFKSMCQQIGLSEEQKDGILKELEAAAEERTMAKKARFTVRAAAFAGLFLLSGMTVFAVGRFLPTDKFAEAMNPESEQPLTPEQEEFYERYGQVLDIEIETAYGTLKHEAALYDDHYLIIPYTYDLRPKEDDSKEDASRIARGNIAYRIKVDLEDRDFLFPLGRYGHIIDSGIAGVESGTYIFFSCEEEEKFEQGGVVQIYKQHDGTHFPTVDKVLGEFTLGAKMERAYLTVDEQTSKLLEEKGVLLKEVSVSPISVFYSCIAQNYGITSVSVVLKDGSEAEQLHSVGHHSYNEGQMKEAYPCETTHAEMFVTPIELDEIAGVRLKAGKTDIWIPME